MPYLIILSFNNVYFFSQKRNRVCFEFTNYAKNEAVNL
ncbi:hypothetical protein HMPREF9296_0231 [Prevotella disiens FB035-09AN]|uniref:Uncharacterized protein n=1 Tax=Prevotella disiens FB035-09AN TaxID=866771 RepID=E1KT38_9BACT|nr:hypothetical protein HMPREF9296_0231 [Prevotella disiens FB035-09AN]